MQNAGGNAGVFQFLQKCGRFSPIFTVLEVPDTMLEPPAGCGRVGNHASVSPKEAGNNRYSFVIASHPMQLTLSAMRDLHFLFRPSATNLVEMCCN